MEAMKEVCEKILGREYVALVDFFKEIYQEKKFNYIIFVSRRCYILFMIIAFVEGWDTARAYSDLGIYAMKHMLMSAKNIAVVDDIGNTGTSAKNVCKKVKRYCNRRCKISTHLFAANRKGLVQKKWYGLRGGSTEASAYYYLPDRQTQSLSHRLLSTILKSGVPYTTFVYPIQGKVNVNALLKSSGLKCYDKIAEENAILSESKWETFYLVGDGAKTLGLDGLDDLFDFQCIRVYRQKSGESALGYLLPFVFLKDMDAYHINSYLHAFADTFGELGEGELKAEIQEALAVKSPWKKDAIEYLACMFSCYCSKLMAEQTELARYVTSPDDTSLSFLKGSFSNTFMDTLKKSDKKFADTFCKIYAEKIHDIRKQEIKPLSASAKAEEDGKKHLEEYSAFALTCKVFGKMWDETKREPQKDFRNKHLAEMVADLSCEYEKRNGNISKEFKDEIYLSQIECWDRGISTYRFSYNDKDGLVSLETLGEMSRLMEGWKYQPIIQEYYNQKLHKSKNLSKKEDIELLERAWKKVQNNPSGSSEDFDINRLKSILESEQEGLYHLLI